MAKCKYKKCKGECCKYISVYLDKPKNKTDFDEIRWFVTHKNVRVYRDHEKQWIIEFISPCKYLRKDQRCSIYMLRPNVCTVYDPEECTFNARGKIYDKIMFSDHADVDRYLEKKKRKKKKKKKNKANK